MSFINNITYQISNYECNIRKLEEVIYLVIYTTKKLINENQTRINQLYLKQELANNNKNTILEKKKRNQILQTHKKKKENFLRYFRTKVIYPLFCTLLINFLFLHKKKKKKKEEKIIGN